MRTRDVRSFRRSLRQFTRIINSQLKTCCTEVTLAQCLVLLEIEETGTPAMGELAARLRLDGSTLSRTVDGLVARGLLQRVDDDSDRRVVKLWLTEQGADVCRSIHKENDDIWRSVLEGIPSSRRRRVTEAFDVLVEAYLAYEDEEESAPCRG